MIKILENNGLRTCDLTATLNLFDGANTLLSYIPSPISSSIGEVHVG